MLTLLVPFAVILPGLAAAVLVRRHGLIPGYVILGLVSLWAAWRVVQIWPLVWQSVSGTENEPLYRIPGEIPSAPSWYLLGYGGVVVAALVVTVIGILVGWRLSPSLTGGME